MPSVKRLFNLGKKKNQGPKFQDFQGYDDLRNSAYSISPHQHPPPPPHSLTQRHFYNQHIVHHSQPLAAQCACQQCSYSQHQQQLIANQQPSQVQLLPIGHQPAQVQQTCQLQQQNLQSPQIYHYQGISPQQVAPFGSQPVQPAPITHWQCTCQHSSFHQPLQPQPQSQHQTQPQIHQHIIQIPNGQTAQNFPVNGQHLQHVLNGQQMQPNNIQTTESCLHQQVNQVQQSNHLLHQQQQQYHTNSPIIQQNLSLGSIHTPQSASIVIQPSTPVMQSPQVQSQSQTPNQIHSPMLRCHTLQMPNHQHHQLIKQQQQQQNQHQFQQSHNTHKRVQSLHQPQQTTLSNFQPQLMVHSKIGAHTLQRYARTIESHDYSRYANIPVTEAQNEPLYSNQNLPPYRPPPDYVTYMNRKTITNGGQHMTYHSESMFLRTEDSSYENLKNTKDVYQSPYGNILDNGNLRRVEPSYTS